MKTNLAWLACLLLLALLTGCHGGKPYCDTSETSGLPNHQCSAAQVTSNVPGAVTMHDRIMAALRDGDGIAVNVSNSTQCYKCSAPYDAGGLITVQSFWDRSTPLQIHADDHWLPQDDANAIAENARKAEKDQLLQILHAIQDIHQYQDTHPRPYAPTVQPTKQVTPTVTVTAAPGPPPPPGMPGWLIAGYVIGCIVTYAMAGGVAGVAMSAYFKHTCCGSSMCEDHQVGSVFGGMFWIIVLPIWGGVWICQRLGHRIADHKHSPRQKRKLLEAQNRRDQIQLDQTKAQTAYLESLAVLAKDGVHIPDFISEGNIGE